MYFNQRSFIRMFSVLLVVSYSNYAGGHASHQVARQKKKYAPPPFEVDSAYFYIQQQVHFGPRVPNTHAHCLCARYLQEELTQLGGQVQVQAFEAKAFNGETLHLKNIIARFNAPHKKKSCSRHIGIPVLLLIRILLKKMYPLMELTMVRVVWVYC